MPSIRQSFPGHLQQFLASLLGRLRAGKAVLQDLLQVDFLGHHWVELQKAHLLPWQGNLFLKEELYN